MNKDEVILQFEGKTISVPAIPNKYIKTEYPENVEIDFDFQQHLQYSTLLPLSASKVYNTKIINSKRLAEGDDIKTVYEIFLDFADIDYEFNPGDSIAILTKNFTHDVDFVLTRMEVKDCDKLCIIKIDENTTKKNCKLPVYVPSYGSYRRLISEVLDIRSIPKKLFLRALIENTADPREQRYLEILCSKEGTMMYRSLILDKEVTFLELLKMLKTCKPTMSLLLEHLPRLMPRPYSIANSHLLDRKKIRIVFSVYSETNLKGLTSSMLENLILNKETGHIPFYLRERTAFSFSKSDITDYNQILIGAGTAISPFIGFLELKKHFEELARGETWLFMGCRYENKNYIYGEDLKQHLVGKDLQKIFEAFSRDFSKTFKYVQDIIIALKSEFLTFLRLDNTKLYVCGNPKMLEEIQEIIEKYLTEEHGSNAVDSKKLIMEWKKSKKYVEDVWH